MLLRLGHKTDLAHACALCGSRESYLDEVITDDRGGRLFVCSDTDYCSGRVALREAAE